jgi:hypothetical protein
LDARQEGALIGLNKEGGKRRRIYRFAKRSGFPMSLREVLRRSGIEERLPPLKGAAWWIARVVACKKRNLKAP